ncbi:hypothetical protein [Cypionkella sinensis]|uniref:Uncharacterized protein n=1 Tax=Cypionkella sinensis TaxID=1756043 RepID=A0ABV7IYM1_9RHOB
MKKIVSWIVAALLAPVIVGLIVDIATPLMPEALRWSVAWSAKLLDWAALSWLVGGGLGFLSGLWLDSFVAAHHGRRPISWKGRADAAADEAVYVLSHCQDVLAEGPPFGRQDRLNMLLVEITAVVETLKALGLQGPDRPNKSDFSGYLAVSSSYLGGIIPALRRGDKNFAVRVDEAFRAAQAKLN